MKQESVQARVPPKVPHVREIIYAEPFQLARRLKDTRALTLLESAQRHEHLGRYSFLACEPTESLVLHQSDATGPQALLAIEALLAKYARAHVAGLPPFQGGLAGFIAYDFAQRLEPKAKIKNRPSAVPEIMLHAYETVIAFDHLQERAWIIARDGAAADDLEARLQAKPAALGSHLAAAFSSEVTRQQHEAAVLATVEYILAGDIFQANITQGFKAATPPDFDVYAYYHRLRQLNPAPFAALLAYGEVQVISSSPERLIYCDGSMIEARPIKGTRRRDDDPSRDAALVAELLASRKDRAENVMIVDLLRNDLSRVAKPGSVLVPVLCGLESYANVHHLVSVVTGLAREGLGQTDVLRAVFPGGSITGAPKIRAMEIIDELEQASRGVYCGAIGYFGFGGHMDFNIAIRTVQNCGGQVRVQGGGGITAKSVASDEYVESLTKIKRIMEAFA
jgi:para-aminobenzoate synthetase component I